MTLPVQLSLMDGSDVTDQRCRVALPGNVAGCSRLLGVGV